MKKHLKFLAIFLLISFNLLSQSRFYALNSSKDKLLFQTENQKRIALYDITNNKIIKTYTLKNSLYENGKDFYSEFEVGFSPNGKMFYILNKFEDTSYTHKNWRPNKYYKEWNFIQTDSGWFINKKVKLSTLNFYSTDSGNFLFSIEDTGFFYKDLAKTYAGVPTYKKGIVKLPCYINKVGFIENNDSLLIVNTYNGFDYDDRKFSIWNFKTKSNLFGYNKVIDFDLKLTDDKKYYYRLYNRNYEPPISGKYRNTEKDFNQVDVFSSEKFEPLKYYNKPSLESNNSLSQVDDIIFDSNNQPFIITRFSQYYDTTNCIKFFFTITKIGENNFSFKSQDLIENKFTCIPIPNSDEIYCSSEIDSNVIIEILNWKNNSKQKLFEFNRTNESFYFLKQPLQIFDRGNKFFYLDHSQYNFYKGLNYPYLPYYFDRGKNKLKLLVDTSKYKQIDCSNDLSFQKNRFSFYFQSLDKNYKGIYDYSKDSLEVKDDFFHSKIIFSKDSTLFLETLSDNSLGLFDSNSKELIEEITISKQITDFDFLEKNKILILSSDKLINIYDILSKKMLKLKNKERE